MKQNVRAGDRAGDLIRGARAVSANPNSAPAVTHTLLTSMWAAIQADQPTLRYWAAKGINADVRRLLKGHQADSEDDGGHARQQQLEMFDPKVQHIVAEIDRERLFVPSRAEFVQLTPDGLSIQEMREAGGFLIGKGEDCIRRGKAVMRLADAMSTPP